MSSYHGERVLSQWNSLRALLDQKLRVPLQGDSLDLASLVAVARYDAPRAFLEAGDVSANLDPRYGTKASIDDLPQDVIEKIHASVQCLQNALDQGHSVYGMPRVLPPASIVLMLHRSYHWFWWQR